MLINKNFKLSVCSLINSLGLSNLIENFSCNNMYGAAKDCCISCGSSCGGLPSAVVINALANGNCSGVSGSSGSHGGSVITNTGTCSGCLRNNCGKSNAQLLAICGNPCKGMSLEVVDAIYENVCR
tara:strand:+ start:285 stop:662 length:378 start_codon:yes stop_codon:yes gene_type:complete